MALNTKSALTVWEYGKGAFLYIMGVETDWEALTLTTIIIISLI